MAIDPIALTRQLVDIESTTYFEGACGIFLHEYLQGLGYEVERQPVEQPGVNGATGERFNVYAKMPGTQPKITLSHTSTPSRRTSPPLRTTLTSMAVDHATPKASSPRR